MPIAHALWIALRPFSQPSRLGYDQLPTVDRGMLLQFIRSLVLLKCAHACEHFLRLWAASYNNVHICKQQNFCLLTSAHSTLENLCLVEKGGNIFVLGFRQHCRLSICSYFENLRRAALSTWLMLWMWLSLQPTHNNENVQGTPHAGAVFSLQFNPWESLFWTLELLS